MKKQEVRSAQIKALSESCDMLKDRLYRLYCGSSDNTHIALLLNRVHEFSGSLFHVDLDAVDIQVMTKDISGLRAHLNSIDTFSYP